MTDAGGLTLARKRKQNVRRYPDGTVHRHEKAADVREVVVLQRLRALAEHELTNPLLGSEIGRIYQGKRITVGEFHAACHWADVVHRYSHAMGMKLPNPKVASLNQVLGRPLAADNPQADLKLRREYDDLFVRLNDCGRLVLAEVSNVVIRDEKVRSLDRLRIGLRALKGLTQKPNTCINASSRRVT